MYRMITLSLIAVVVFLAAVTAALIRLNWTERVLTPILVIGLLASVVALSSVLLQLKTPAIVKISFDTPVIIDLKTHLPPQVTSSSSLGKRLGRYAFLAQPVDQGREITQAFSPPSSEREEADYYCEMLQYAIFNEMVTLSSPSNGDRPDISNIEKIPLRSIQSEYAHNQFSNGTAEKWFIANKDAYLPRDTMVSISKKYERGFEGRSIILTRQFFFKIRIDIQHRMTSAVGAFPTGVAITEKSNHPFCHSAVFYVSMTATFDKLSSASDTSEELREWAQWLFGQIEQRYALSAPDLKNLQMNDFTDEATLPQVRDQ